jgi:4-amino-4-deoxy-L-arabinose transferase-like glycosyltransferase
LLLTLLAGVFRFYRLTAIPPGLHFDEAFKGVMARQMAAAGRLQIFFPSNQGEEPLATYLVGAAMALFGDAPWVVRLPSAIAGTLTVPLAWWLGRGLYRLARPDSPLRSVGERMAGLGTALVLAIFYWHLSFSRIGMEPILVPFFATLAFAALVHGLNDVRSGRAAYGFFALAGASLAGGCYTYKAGYFVPIVAALFVAYAAVVERGFVRRCWRGLVVAALVAALVALPLAIYFAVHPEDFLHRPTSVTLVDVEAPGGSWQTIADNVPRVLGMFFARGDANPRSNLPGRPALDPFLALLFTIGIGRAVAGLRRPAHALPLIWLGVMTVPTLVTEYAPHFPRAIGATPAIAFLCALGAWTVWQGAARLSTRWVRALAVALLAVGILYSGAAAAWTYFVAWGTSPDLYYAYDVGLVDVAAYVRSVPPTDRVYVTPTRADHYTLHLLAGRPFATYDGRAGLVFPPPGQAAKIIIVVQEDQVTEPLLTELRPDVKRAGEWSDPYGRSYAVAYHLPARDASVPQPPHPAGAILGGAAELLGYSVDAERVAPGSSLHLTLHWRVLAPLDRDYTVFTHLLGGHNPATNGPVWAGHDGQPVSGRYATTAWQPGEVILDVHPLSLPSDAPPGQYRIEVGLYDLATMARLPAVDVDGERLPDDAVILGGIEVSAASSLSKR